MYILHSNFVDNPHLLWFLRFAKKAVKGPGLDDFKFLSKKNKEEFVASNDRLIIVAFRGTEPTHLQDLLSDAKIRKVSCPAGKMHRGFVGAYQFV